MKRLALFLCGLLLVCGADLFAQDAQTSPNQTGLHQFVADPGGMGEKVNVASLPRAQRDPEEVFQTYALRAILRYMRIVPDEVTTASLPARKLRYRSAPL